MLLALQVFSVSQYASSRARSLLREKQFQNPERFCNSRLKANCDFHSLFLTRRMKTQNYEIKREPLGEHQFFIILLQNIQFFPLLNNHQKNYLSISHCSSIQISDISYYYQQNY